MVAAAAQEVPPSAVTAKVLGPAEGPLKRSHTTYTKLASAGSAVIEPLSLKNWAPSRMSAAGALQVLPPSLELATSMALEEPAPSTNPLKDSESAWIVPSGEAVSQTSLARA